LLEVRPYDDRVLREEENGKKQQQEQRRTVTPIKTPGQVYPPWDWFFVEKKYGF
jgi:hypothetical protein